jgi:HAD superfamily hydrolase (TIGR01490 family)
VTQKQTIVAYFDFDGTITTKDTLIPFLLFAVGKLKFIYNLPRLITIVISYWLRIITNEQAKEKTLTLLLSGMKEYKLEHLAKAFALTQLHKYIKPVVYAKIEWHREHHHKLFLVSANLGVYLRYWANLHKLDGVIATELELENETVTGRIKTRNCYAIQKVNRINEFLVANDTQFCYSYAYGNSAGDYELLEYVNEPFWVNGDYIEQWGGR